MATQQQQQQQEERRQQFAMKLDLPTLQSTEIEHAKPRSGPQSPQLGKDAKRAMSHTAGWQPSLAGQRESSYRQEDRRREMMMGSGSGSVSASSVDGGAAGQQQQGKMMGFSEGPGA
ncbi:hypothetical protein GGR55DRAFT_558978 [Xylaria sp. FL0064]|nr:hypothetical protein GGR55DRAFT_558978 [Xylaria sp. FL0064]